VASTGSAIASIDSSRTPTRAWSPSPQAWDKPCAWSPRLAHAVPAARGKATIIITRESSSSGTTSSTQAVTTVRAHQVRADELRHRFGNRPAIVGLMWE
jgi:hypothetical protein